ncbi:MAG: hypothetical protein ABI778_12510, partial [Ignavibacteriota bacterium]
YALPMTIHFFLCGYGKDTSVLIISRNTDRAITARFGALSKSSSDFSPTYIDAPETFCDTTLLYSPIGTTVFPNPFVFKEGAGESVLNILASNEYYAPLEAALNIYGPDNTLVRHIERATVPHESLAADPYGGSWYVQWDGFDDTGRPAPSGVYLYSIVVNGVRSNGKFVIIRKN